MATLTVRNLEDEVVRRLRIRAAEHGRSTEAEHREILRAAVCLADQTESRRQVAERLADFRRRTGGRDSAPSADLLEQTRSARTHSLTDRSGAA